VTTLRRLWRLLPAGLRTSRPATYLKRLLGSQPAPAIPHPETPHAPADQPRVIQTLEDLDAAIRHLEAAAAISDDALRREFPKFTMRTPADLPGDPDSEGYRARQFALYERLHGKPYSLANETSAMDVLERADRPFPFLTGSSMTVGSQLMAIGFLIRQLDLPAASRVLEFGPGWGNTTIALGRMGHHVTAVDIEPNFVALIAERSRRKRLGSAIDVRQGDFSSISQLDGTFHTVLFFESFHHSSNHQTLVAGFDGVVAPGGQVVFAGEPISAGFPIPWGLRLDGESLWAIRRYGWLELGFREDYFINLFARHGWSVTKAVSADLEATHSGWGTVYTARRSRRE